MGTARRKPTPERGRWISQLRQSGLSPSVGAAETFQSDHPGEVKRVAASCLSPAREKHDLAAHPTPAESLVNNKRHGSMQPITVPVKLPAQRASDKVRDAE
jgi:hypothetical protein